MLAEGEYPRYYEPDQMQKFISSPFGKDTLLAEWPHSKSVSAAYWDPRGRSIVSTSYDDNLRSTFSPFSLLSRLLVLPFILVLGAPDH